jgi:hypothetical protein
MTITAAIKKALKRFRLSPEEINNGHCGFFASHVQFLLKDNCTIWHVPGFHTWIEVDGRYYDAETPAGVRYPSELPYWQRLRAESGEDYLRVVTVFRSH